MIKFYKKILPNKEDWQLYTLLALLYTVFLISDYLFPYQKIWNFLNDNILFYFSANFSDFQIWFPRFGLELFIFEIILKILCLIIVSFFLYRIIKKMIVPLDTKIQISDFHYTNHLVKQTTILVVFLCYYIGLYFLFLNCFQHDFFNFQILIARGFLVHIIFQISKNCIRYRLILVDYLKRFLLEPQLPYSISILRILFFSYLALIYLVQVIKLPTFDLKNKVALPFIGWLIAILPLNSDIYMNFIYLGIVCCLFIIIGFKTRFFLIINSICVFYIVATPNFYGKLWHNQIIIWIVWFFMFSKCYDVFSMDSFLKKKPIQKSANYTFPARFVWIQFGIIYFWAGFYKLWDSGFDWALGSSMINQVQLEWVQAYDKVPAIRIDHYPMILYIGGLITILFELTYFLFVLRPKWRWVSAFGGILMHNLIGYFMYISFLPVLQVFYVFYFDFNRLFVKIKNKITIEKGYSKVPFYFGITIITINGLLGMFHIDSYPFSSYPSYSAIIPDKVKIIDFRPISSPKTVHEIGEANDFRWEDYGWLEDNLIKDFESGKNVQKQLEDYWAIWVIRNPQLKAYHTINVYLIERPVAPEGKNKIVCLNKMGIIKN